MANRFRYYQTEADNAIYAELQERDKCIVKMFCGTGKSLLMRYCKITQNKKLVVYVFPSLPLIQQFYADYLGDFPLDNVLCVSSENGSTTDPAEIVPFISRPQNRIICVTYQSFKTLVDALGPYRISVCIFDEAHHAVGETYQKLIFENDFCDKQIFFTATPKNANGVVMYDRENLDAGMCGKLVYDYSYLRGVNEGYLNPFEIRIDMFTDNTNRSVYETIARSVLASGNSRVLTFHSDVNTDRDKSVLNFVNEAEFKRVFKEIQKAEFPQIKKYKKISMIGLTASINSKQRTQMLAKFDATSDNEVIVISSCETIGEGIDTKNANMCVFVDPKSSSVKIIQNIGRIVRKQFGVDKPNSTILIPCWVDRTKYLECGGDREKCDEVIRQDMSEDGGNFNGILNVMSALKQEDEDLYDICLHYPDSFSPQEIRSNLEKQGFCVGAVVGDGELMETLEDLLETEIDYENYEDCDTTEEMIMNIAEDNDVCIEIHTDSFETPIERYNSECESGEVVRLYRDSCNNEYDEEDGEAEVYMPILAKQTGEKRTTEKVDGPKRDNRMRVNVHTNSDVKVLWKITGDFDITKDICSCVIDCEVVQYDPMEVAVGIVERAKERESRGGNLLPRQIQKKQITTELEDENKDAVKLQSWKKALNGKGKSKCCDNVRDYLDKNLTGWREKIHSDESKLLRAQEIVKRALERQQNGGRLVPKNIEKTKRTSSELEQESKDAQDIQCWKRALNGCTDWVCPDNVKDYLDEQMPGWRDKLSIKAINDAKCIVERALIRQINGLNLLPRRIKNRTTPELEQEHKDAQKLGDWKKALKRQETSKCSDEVRDYLDKNLKDWRKEQDFDEQAMEDAKNIVERANKRVENKLNFLPRNKCDNKEKQITTEFEQEYKDAKKLGHWRDALKGQGSSKCSDEIRDYLDKNLKDWRKDWDEKAMENAKAIVKRAIERRNGGGRLIPKKIVKLKRTTSELEQEDKDANKLHNLKSALNGSKNSRCSDEVRDYLDENLKGWRSIDNNSDTQSIASYEVSEPVIEEEPKTFFITPAPRKKSMKLQTQPVLKESQEQTHQRAKSELSTLHQRYKTLTSQHLRQEFHSNPELWHKYHEIAEENEQSFPDEEIPRNRIIQELNKIKTKRTKQVVDMGCGKADIAKYFATDPRFHFTNYDHISSNDTVESCDIANTPLEDDSVEICILSLAMWGSNCKEYVQEANRILESGGKLYIIEPTKRWSDKDESGNIVPGKEGKRLEVLLEENGFKIVEQSVEKFCLLVGIKV